MNIQPLLDAINDRNIVSGLTHDIYRYPARFSPTFARTAIELFTEPGDTILDPFIKMRRGYRRLQATEESPPSVWTKEHEPSILEV